MAATIWKENNENEWQGTKGREAYKILRKPIGRGKYTYHCYYQTKYIANGASLDEAKINVDAYIKAHA